MEITVNSYFSGAGLLDIGLQSGGMKLQQSFELDPVCCSTQKNNFSHDIIEGDIKSKTVLKDKESDVMVATYPCTKYSTAADIHGKRQGDDLFLHFFRHIAIRRPEIYIVENVPGMKKFPVVMEAMTLLPEYYVSVFCPVKTEIWLPQRRNRLILIGSRKPFEWKEPANRKGIPLKDILEDCPEITIPQSVYYRLEGKYRDLPIISDPETGDIAPTCVAHYSKDQSTRLLKDKRYPKGVRPYTPREYARLQGVPDSFQFLGSSNQIYRQIGNGVPVPIGMWLAGEIARYYKSGNKRGRKQT